MTKAASTSPFDDLGKAILTKDVARAETILARHPELKRRLDDPVPGGHFDATALLMAVGHRDRAMIDVLLGHGADINARSHWWAGGFGVLDRDPDDLTEYLIERGATVDVHAAAKLGRLDRLKELLREDPALARARGGDGQTPLHVARTVEIAKCLIDAGADIDARDVDHESTPAQYLIRDHQDIVRMLVELGCTTDLLMAAALGDAGLVRRHLEGDPSSIGMTVSDRWFPKRDPRAGGSIYIWTLGQAKLPHSIAREFGHEHIVQLLMEHSPAALKLAAACELGEEPLAAELAWQYPEIARMLSDDLARRLPDAAKNENVTAVRLLLGAGWPVDAHGDEGATALHWACWNGNLPMVREILRRRPSLDAKDPTHGGTPLGWATYGSTHGWRCRTGDYAGVVSALLDAGAAMPPRVEDDPDVSEAVREVIRGRR
jgi:ankyrin repeat protein